MRPLSVLLALSCLARTALAQQPDSARAGRPRADSVRWILPALTVEAVRESRSRFDVPLAITRVDPQSLFGTSGYSVDAAVAQVPGVLAQSRYGGSDVRLVIRGFGARGAGDRSNAGTTRGIRVLIDGVPETEPDGRTSLDNVDLASVTSVEVIRSNASALWGNAAGGVVSLSTLSRAPARALTVERQLGGFGLRRASVRGEAPLGAHGSFSAALVHTGFDGWRQHSAASRWLATLSAAAPVGARTTLGVYAIASHNAFRVPGPLTRSQVDSAPARANATYLQRDERRDNHLARIAVSLAHRLDARNEVSTLLFAGPKALQRSERGTFRDFTRYHVGGNAVWRSTAPLGPRVAATLLAGVDEAYQDGAILFYSLTPEGTRGGTLRTDKREGANNLGAFVQAEVDALAHLGVTAGGRFDAITYSADDYLDPAIDARRTFSRVTPKLGVNWRFGASHSVYASVGGGVEAPAGNETDPASTFGQDTVTALNPLLEPIRSTTYEVGTKHVLSAGGGLVRAVAYDVAVYRTDVVNEIVPYRGGRFYFTAGRARRTGAELGVTLLAAGGVRLDGAGAWSHNRYVAYAVDSVHYGRPGALADYSGNRIVGVPDLIWSGSVAWSLGGATPLTARLAVQGTSGYFVDDANLVSVAAHAVANLTVGLDEPLALGGGLGVRGFVTVNNLFDRRYVASAFLNPDVVNGEPVAFEPGLPRHMVVGLTVAWR